MFSTPEYHTLLRSHADTIHACALDPSDLREEFGTVSAVELYFGHCKHTRTVMSLQHQKKDARCIAYQPTPQNSDIDVHRVACGFR